MSVETRADDGRENPRRGSREAGPSVRDRISRPGLTSCSPMYSAVSWRFRSIIREDFGVERLPIPNGSPCSWTTTSRSRIRETRIPHGGGTRMVRGPGRGRSRRGRHRSRGGRRELGYATPGAFVVHFDGHVSQLGAYGALAMGIHIGLYEAFARPTIHLRAPSTVRVDLAGSLPRGVMARDVVHALISRHGADFCNGSVLELGGPGAESLTLEDLQTITGLAMFTGAVTAIVEPGPRSLAYALPRARTTPRPVRSDQRRPIHPPLSLRSRYRAAFGGGPAEFGEHPLARRSAGDPRRRRLSRLLRVRQD